MSYSGVGGQGPSIISSGSGYGIGGPDIGGHGIGYGTSGHGVGGYGTSGHGVGGYGTGGHDIGTTSSQPGIGGHGTGTTPSAYSDNSSYPWSQPFSQPMPMTRPLPSSYRHTSPSETSTTFVSGTSAEPRSGKAALIAQQYENVQQRYPDSEMRFDEDEELEPAPLRPLRDIPPTYSSIGN